MNALDSFYTDSSDQRGMVHDSIDALAKILKGLADGVRQVDHSLHDSLPEVSEQASAPARRVVEPDKLQPSGARSHQ
jgi:hypothetical protein